MTMKSMNMMAKLAKGMMMAVLMTAGLNTASAQEEGTGTEQQFKPTEASNWWMGEDVANTTETYLYNVGAGIFATDNTPSVTDIENANLWTIGEGNTFTNNVNGLNIQMSYKKGWGYSWSTDISNSSATSFTLASSKDTKDRASAYKLSVTAPKEGLYKADTRYFNIDQDKNEYTAAHTNGTFNDWLLISAKQKAAYTTYSTLFNTVATLQNEELSKELADELQEVLTNTSTTNYSNFDSDKADLEAIQQKINAYLETITGISNINSKNTKASVIYNTNGIRMSQMSKGINIIKMNDGSIKKVLVK